MKWGVFMLGKNFDIAIIGKNYLSFLFALGQIDLGQRVLVLDDQRLNFGNLYRHGLGPIEYHFLKTWGEDRRIAPLINIDRYLTQRPLHIFFNDNWFQLGHTPAQNMRELLRRLGEIFGGQAPSLWKNLSRKDYRQQFDAKIEQLAKILGQNAFRYQTVESFNIQFFLSQCPAFLEKIFTGFRQYFEDDFNVKNRAHLLAFLSRAFTLKTLSPKIASYEIFHMFINLLGHSYSLDQDRLEQDLITCFVDNGGQFKTTEVREWKFHKGKPWCLELASFEGIIHPRKVVFSGSAPKSMPLKIGDTNAGYENVVLENSVSGKEAGHLPKGNFIFGHQSRMGTDFPLWWLELLEESHGRRKFRIHALSALVPGSKIEFFQDRIVSLVEGDLAKIFPLAARDLKDWKIRVGCEIYVRKSRKTAKGHLPLRRKIRFFDYSTPSRGQRIKNVHYFGPYLESPLGLLSKLMEIKRSHSYT